MAVDVQIPIALGKVNVIANIHTAYLAYEHCGKGMVITIRPPQLIRERYRISNGEIIWLTYFPEGYEPSYTPDRFEFEVMEKIIRFLKEGGKCILLDCVEYIEINHGKARVYEFIRKIKEIKEGITIIVGVNGDVDKWSGVGDYIYEERIEVRDARVKIVDNVSEENTLIIGLKSGVNRINIEEFGDTGRFLFEGIDKIRRIVGSEVKNVAIEATGYLITTSREDILFNFLKDLMDIVVSRGGKVLLKKDESIYFSKLITLCESTGLEEKEIFVDRREELQLLKDALNLRRKRLILISGEVGIGKTALVMKLKAHAILKGFKFIYARSYYESNEPYLPILEAFSRYGGILKGEVFKPTDIRSFEAQRNAMFYEFTSRVKDFVKKAGKIMVFFDDIHWMDYSSLRLFHYLVSNLQDENVLFVATYRDEEISDEFRDVLIKMMRENLYDEIKLGGLKYEDVKKLLGYLLNDYVPDKFARMIYEKCGGNPLYTKELVSELINKGFLDPEKMEYPEEINVELPALIRGIVERKLSVLGDDERRIAEIASVIGYRIDPELLLQVGNLDEMKLVEIMEKLEKYGIVCEGKEGEIYLFRERITRDGIYEMISRLRRKVLHRKIAETMEHLYGGDGRYYGDIGRHYERCGIHKKAYEYYIKAAEKAEGVYAHEDAIKFYERATNLDIDLEKKVDLYKKIGEIYSIIGEYDMAGNYYLEALKLAEESAPEKIGAIKMEIGNLYERMGRYAHAKRYYREALVSVNDDRLRARILNLMGLIEFREGNYDRGREFLKEAIEISDGKYEDELAMSYHILGTIYEETGDYELALEFLKKAIEIREKLGDKYELARSYNNIGVVYDDLGDLDRGLWYYQKSLELAREIGDMRGIGGAYNNIGVIYERRGEPDKALEYFKKSLGIKEKTGDRYGLAVTTHNIGVAYLWKGEFKESFDNLKKALELYEGIGNKRGVADICNSLSIAYAEYGDIENAIKYAEIAMKISNEINSPGELSRSYANLSRAYTIMGDLGKAIDYGEKALSIAMEMNAKTEILESYLVLGIAYGEAGDYEKGQHYLLKAINASDEMGMRGKKGVCLYYLALLYRKNGDTRWKKTLRDAYTILNDVGYVLYLQKMKGQF